METWRWTAVPLVALLWPASFPASAVGGYDTAHIVKRTCEPGGPLIVADKWKHPRDRDRVVTEPGEVIACPGNSFQIAAGPERIGGETVLCTYISLLGDDGADRCLDTGSGSLLEPLMMIQADRSDRLALVGIVGDDVATVAVAPDAGISGELALIPIERPRAARLGATRTFAYFSLTVDRRTVCAHEALRVLGSDGSGRRIAESAVPTRSALLTAADRVAYARSLDGLQCRPRSPLAWLTRTWAVLRWLLWPRTGWSAF
jgi:hypothetical protein